MQASLRIECLLSQNYELFFIKVIIFERMNLAVILKLKQWALHHWYHSTKHE